MWFTLWTSLWITVTTSHWLNCLVDCLPKRQRERLFDSDSLRKTNPFARLPLVVRTIKSDLSKVNRCKRAKINHPGNSVCLYFRACFLAYFRVYFWTFLAPVYLPTIDRLTLLKSRNMFVQLAGTLWDSQTESVSATWKVKAFLFWKRF